MDTEIYQEELRCTSKSFFGESDKMVKYTEIGAENIPILKAFLEDNDIQEIKLVSTNIGFIKSYTKVYRK